jgi:hypothetical protein
VLGRYRGGVRRLAVIIMTALACTACTKSVTQIDTTTTTVVTSTVDHRPVRTGPTTAAAASRCPFVDEQAAADYAGMRLARITVLRSDGKVVGCRIYALQNSPLHNSEKLPPANQPAVEITLTRYRSAAAAHDAIVLAARAGTNPQQVRIGTTTGVCFQTRFYAKDDGQDWACAYAAGTTLVLVRTVVVSPALNAVEIARAIRLP